MNIWRNLSNRSERRGRLAELSDTISRCLLQIVQILRYHNLGTDAIEIPPTVPSLAVFELMTLVSQVDAAGNEIVDLLSGEQLG